MTLKNKGGNSTGHDMLKRIDAGLVDEKDKCWWRDDRGNIDLFIWKRANGSFATVQFCRGDSVVEIRSGETQAYGTVDNAEGGFRRIQSPTFHFADQTSPEMPTPEARAQICPAGLSGTAGKRKKTTGILTT